MEIAVIGLGLMGGSICKAIKKNTDNTVYGWDIDENTMLAALASGSIEKSSGDNNISSADITFVCLYPAETISYIKTNLDKFKKGSIICDICGVKEFIIDELEEIIMEKGINFIGTHPMAGREFSGFDYSDEKIFSKASFIITETANSSKDSINVVESLAMKMGFANVVISTPSEHDETIAFTSQLAHVVSNAFVKSPRLIKHKGFSAGSFQDLTRVAKLNEIMWSSLFILNGENLINEIDTLTGHLLEYRDALLAKDEEKLKQLLKDGRVLKESSEKY